MKYKTMVLELLQQRPKLYDQLCRTRTVLATLEEYALQLRDRHQTWMDQLALAKPDSAVCQIASEAMELAVEELESRLPTEYPADSEALSLDGAMAYIARHTPRA